MKSKWFVWLAWTIVCTVVTAVVTPWEFLSFFFVGGALGIVQWPVLWARFVRLDLWVPVSLLGWFIGTILAIVVSPLIGPVLTVLVSRYEALVHEMGFESI